MQVTQKEEIACSQNNDTDDLVAALDIGSNSFHMVVARRAGNDFQIISKLKEQVRLAQGLDEQYKLDSAAFERAFECLDTFSAELEGVDPENVLAVATYTLRAATNAEDFIERAKQHFPAPIRIISGIEEARLIYQGVAHISDIHDQVLVIDIGGGSTEFIIGRDFTEKRLRSCTVGCVNLTKTYFNNGKVSNTQFRKAIDAAEQEISHFRDEYLKTGWKLCLGSSGSIKAIARILKAQGYHKRSITLDHLLALRSDITQFGSLKDIDVPGLIDSRSEILPAAVAILIAAFKALDIERMEYSRGALREGLLYDMLGNGAGAID